MFNFGRHLVMNNSFLIFTNNVDTEFKVILGLKFVRFRVPILRRKPSVVYECAIRRLNIADPDLALPVSPNLCVLPRQNFRVKKSICWCWNSLRIRLSSYSEAVWVVWYRY